MKYHNFANRVSDNNKPEMLLSLIDLSPSMDWNDYEPSRKAGAIKANIELLKLKLEFSPQDMMGIVGFGDDAKLLHPLVCLSTGSASLRKALKDPQGSCGTNFTSALKLAKSHLFSCDSTMTDEPLLSRILSMAFLEPADQSECPDDSKMLRRIIMLTDGEYNRGGSPLKIASELKSRGVVIDCIGIGGSPEDIDERVLKQIASRNPDGSIRYSFIGDQGKLIKKYRSLAQHIRFA